MVATVEPDKECINSEYVGVFTSRYLLINHVKLLNCKQRAATVLACKINLTDGSREVFSF